MKDILAIAGGKPVRTLPFDAKSHDFGEDDVEAVAEVIRSGFLRALGTGEPLNVYVPAVGLSKAEMQFSRVVLPEPEGPNKMMRSPS